MSEHRDLPVVPLRNAVVFPGVAVPVLAGRAATLRAIEKALKGDHQVFTVAQRENDESPSPDQLYSVGVVTRIQKVERNLSGLNLVLHGEHRASVAGYRFEDGHLQAEVARVHDVLPADPESISFDAMYKELRERAVELGKQRGLPNELLGKILEEVQEPGRFTDLLAAYLELPVEELQGLLENLSVEERMRRVLVHVQRQINMHQAREEIKTKVEEKLGERQREMYLREQMNAIRKELGESDPTDEMETLRQKLEDLDLPDEARKEVDREFSRLKRTGGESMEAQVIRNYLDWVVDLPWNERSADNLDLKRANRVLEEDHHGLKDVKDRVLEFLAVRQLRARQVRGEENDGEKARAMAKGPILLFIGPPGTGKSSIAKSIARAVDREFVRISLGGVRDEADIRGHRRTYVGSMPGRIIQGLKRAQTKNPVFLLDEVDKLSASYQGNPASALLEVLDPMQNDAFTDHYLNLPFDLSEVLFIATANFVENIPAPLLDRMETVEFSGYTEREKAEIAKKYLIPRQLEEAAIADRNVRFGEKAISVVVSQYTHESGVRQLEQKVGAVARKIARRLAAGERGVKRVTPHLVRKLLGRPGIRPERANPSDEVGVATGMYYTPRGGDIMFVEASIRRLYEADSSRAACKPVGCGQVSLIMTGHLGEVMQESARAALTYATARSDELDIAEDLLGSLEVHVHVPAGAVPKDGPSAGVAMATSIVSALTRRPVRRDVAMTGEITLRGRVLPIGGVKEKVLGAHRAGITTVLLPRENHDDLEDIPRDVREQMTFHPIDSLDDVIGLALVNHSRPAARHQAA